MKSSAATNYDESPSTSVSLANETGQSLSGPERAEYPRVKNIAPDRFIQSKLQWESTWSERASDDSENRQEVPKDLRPIVKIPTIRPLTESFTALQSWEGVVQDVGKETIFARLTDLLGQGEDAAVEIYIEEIDKDDRELIEIGAVFYWTIGYLERASGRQRSSIIRFRRLPVWREKDLKLAEKRASAILAALDGSTT